MVSKDLTEKKTFQEFLDKVFMEESIFSSIDEGFEKYFEYHVSDLSFLEEISKAQFIFIVLKYYENLIKKLSDKDVASIMHLAKIDSNSMTLNISSKEFGIKKGILNNKNILSSELVIYQKKFFKLLKKMKRSTKTKEAYMSHLKMSPRETLEFLLNNKDCLPAFIKKGRSLPPKLFIERILESTRTLSVINTDLDKNVGQDFKNWYVENIKRSRKKFQGYTMREKQTILNLDESIFKEEEVFDFISKKIEELEINSLKNDYEKVDTILKLRTKILDKSLVKSLEKYAESNKPFLNIKIPVTIFRTENNKYLKEIFLKLGATILNNYIEEPKTRSDVFHLLCCTEEDLFNGVMEDSIKMFKNRDHYVIAAIEKMIPNEFLIDLTLNGLSKTKLRLGLHDKTSIQYFKDYLIHTNENFEYIEELRDYFSLNYQI
jgi:hypothetical protein